MADDGAHHEIVIIRRGGHGDHDEHHGGVWKIAFADFMTAMMAFFLVMWLISANDKTRASVARYFNPVRLVDATTQPRGLHDVKKDESGITASPDTKKPVNDKGETKKAVGEASSGASEKAETPAQKEKRLDGALRDNPLAALAEIAGAPAGGNRAGGPRDAAPPAIGRRGGEAFRDPFAPATTPPAGAAAADEDAAETLARETLDPSEAPAAEIAKDAAAASTAEQAKPDKGKAEAGNAAGEAKAVLSALHAGAQGAAGPAIEVRRTEEGLVLSLTDTAEFAMFANGSAVPAKQVVAMMDRVASVIKERTGVVVVRGFTDNRPFRGKRYDNWHLSLDRAQVAHYMLVHGGLDDRRIARVEGYADRGVKTGVDPASPLNRRIEIVLKDAG